MKRSIFLVFAFAGCGAPPEPPAAAKATGQAPLEEIATPVDGVKPATTSPDAKALLDKLIAVHTGNNPKALDAFQRCKVEREGKLLGSQITPSLKQIETYTWPSRFQFEFTVTLPPEASLPPSITKVDAENGKIRSNAQNPASSEMLVLEGEVARDFIEDIHANCMLLLFPLLDPSVVAQVEPVSPEGTTALRVWVRDRDPVVYLIDAKTGRMSKLLYAKHRDEKMTIWTFECNDFRETRGVWLAHSLKRYSPIQKFSDMNAATFTPLAIAP